MVTCIIPPRPRFPRQGVPLRTRPRAVTPSQEGNVSLSLPTNESQKPAQRAEWTIQRVSWVVWGAILVAGLAGLLGPGPLSTTEVEAPDQSISVRFNRFEHYSRPGTWELALHPRETATELRVEISAPLLHNVQVLRIEPEPKGSTLKDDTIVYTFN